MGHDMVWHRTGMIRRMASNKQQQTNKVTGGIGTLAFCLASVCGGAGQGFRCFFLLSLLLLCTDCLVNYPLLLIASE
ncbi:hypothetical protein F5144DRAFT_141308 [Chaetomium tenue]|uniref:Uncharacterized protein n=1 Tax=Chaetomium tenue TaxID=1854479 RepID=A0ACB7PIL7_9PEZI|nr:hypothetical protein F5144DRAFT_141308 [Chaetomium globosum]